MSQKTLGTSGVDALASSYEALFAPLTEKNAKGAVLGGSGEVHCEGERWGLESIKDLEF